MATKDNATGVNCRSIWNGITYFMERQTGGLRKKMAVGVISVENAIQVRMECIDRHIWTLP